MAPILQVVVAGWTGRDRDGLETHIRELEDLGVPRPAAMPIYYRVSAARATVASRIQASGARSSGEVEFVLAQWEGRLWVGVGSDHTDREVAAYNVTVSKQMCDKPIAPEFWSFEEIADHWDALVLRSFVHENGQRLLYQEGSVSTMLDPAVLIDGYCGEFGLPEGSLMLCGTLAAKGGIRPADRFEYEIEDPVLNRKIHHAYHIVSLPAVG